MPNFFDSYPHIQKPYFHGFRTSNGIIAFPTLSFPHHVQDIGWNTWVMINEWDLLDGMGHDWVGFPHHFHVLIMNGLLGYGHPCDS